MNTTQVAMGLEKYLISPSQWEEHRSVCHSVMPIDVYGFLFGSEREQGIGLGRHPDKGYFVLGCGQGPYLEWAQWKDGLNERVVLRDPEWI